MVNVEKPVSYLGIFWRPKRFYLVQNRGVVLVDNAYPSLNNIIHSLLNILFAHFAKVWGVPTHYSHTEATVQDNNEKFN